MNTATLKDARMELKTTADAKDMLCLAASIEGMDLTAFVLGSAMERARKVLCEHTNIALTREGQATLARLLTNRSAPTKAMKDLMKLPDLPGRKA